MEIENKRGLINFTRGVAVFLMLWGHALQFFCGDQFDFFENVVFKTIYSFHMPLFMLISGFLFYYSEQKRTTEELILYKAKSLLYPILMCSVLNYLFKIPDAILQGGYISVIGGTSVTRLWFLWSVLAGSIALGFAVKTQKNSVLRIMFIIVGVVFVAILPCGTMNVFMYPYFVIGYYYSKHFNKLEKFFSVFALISFVMFVIMLIFYEKKHYIYISGLFGGESLFDTIFIDLFRWFIGLFGSVAVIWICKKIHSFLRGDFIKGIELLGKESLAVYVLAESLLSELLPKLAIYIFVVFSIDWNKYIWLYNFVITPVVAVIYSFLLVLIIKLLKRIKIYKYIFGR